MKKLIALVLLTVFAVTVFMGCEISIEDNSKTESTSSQDATSNASSVTSSPSSDNSSSGSNSSELSSDELADIWGDAELEIETQN